MSSSLLQTKVWSTTTTVPYWSCTATQGNFLSFTAPGNDLRTNLTLSHTFSLLFTSCLPHITSCLGSCVLTAAQITGPQTWRRPALRRGTEEEEEGRSTSGSETVWLSGEERRLSVIFYLKLRTLCVMSAKEFILTAKKSDLCSRVPLIPAHRQKASDYERLSSWFWLGHVNNFHGFTGKG